MERIPVYVTASDPILDTGVSTQLRSRPELTVLDSVHDFADAVCVVVGDEADDATLRLVRELRGRGLRQIIMVLAHIDDTALFAAIESGACGLLRRQEASPERLVTAITQAASMGGVLSPKLLGRLLEQVNRLQTRVLAPRGIHLSALSDREVEVLRLMAQGMEVKEIAGKLA